MATFAETMVAKYEALLAASAGLDTISVDGQPVTATAVPWSDWCGKRTWKRSTGTGSARSPREPVSPFRMDPLGRFGSNSPETRNRLSAVHSALCTLHFAPSLRPPHAKK